MAVPVREASRCPAAPHEKRQQPPRAAPAIGNGNRGHSLNGGGRHGKRSETFPRRGVAMASTSDLGNPSLVQGFGRVVRSSAGPAAWADDLTPIADSDWSYDFKIERAYI